MKERLINNLGLKLISLFLAFFVWLSVVNVSNPEVSRSQEVALEIENGEVLLAAGRAYEINGKSTVTVTYDVHTLDEYKIRPSDFRAYVDLSELYDVTGSVAVKVEVLNNSAIIRNAAAKPSVVRVATEELQTKTFSLAVHTTGKTADGYALSSAKLAPENVVVKGPMSKVGLISYVGVEIPLDGLSGSYEGVTEPVFYDANGSELKVSDRVEINTDEIRYALTINKIKELALNFEVSGTVAPGYRYTGVECNIRSVAVTGMKSSLADVNTVTIPGSELNIEGASEDRIVTVDVSRFLPDGVQAVESTSCVAEIHLHVEPLVTKEITLLERDIELVGASDDLEYRITPSRLTVTVQGLAEDLESLRGADLLASADVSGLQTGEHGGSLHFGAAEVFTVVDHAAFRIEVKMKTGVVGPTAAETSTEAQEQESTSGETDAAASAQPEDGTESIP